MWLEKAGADVTVHPTALLPGLPRAFTRLLEKDPRGPKDVLLHFAEPRRLRPDPDSQHLRLKVAYTMWERTPITEDDFAEVDEAPWATMRRDGTVDRYEGSTRLGWWDKVVVTCPMNREAFRPITPDEVPIDVVPCGIDPKDWPFQRRDFSTGRPVRFLMVGMLAGRKDPFAFLNAWREAFEREPNLPAELHLHTLAPGLVPQITNYAPNITFSQKPLSREQLIAMYHDHDVLVSTSRGEGNNKPAMEFMATGGVPMATDWSGHQNWLDKRCTIPLDGALEQSPYAPWAQDFAVDHDYLVHAILSTVEERASLPAMGEQAHRYAGTALSWEHTVQRLLQSISRSL